MSSAVAAPTDTPVAGARLSLGLKGEVTLLAGDCLERLAELEAESLDACVTDPPYHLTSIVDRFGAPSAAWAQAGATGAYARASRGFMGQQWDGGDIAFRPDTWRAVYRVLKPGAHLVAFSAPRTYHRMTCAIEDAGFEIRDCILDVVGDAPVRAFLDTLTHEQEAAWRRVLEESQFGGLLAWVYGSGFPKSHDLARAIDKTLRHEGEDLPTAAPVKRMVPGAQQYREGWQKSDERTFTPRAYEPVTDAARRWQGWGTALKPAFEPIVLARKPLSELGVARNVLRHGVGGLNIDACRVGVREGPKVTDPKGSGHHRHHCYGAPSGAGKLLPDGRWPANVVHDGSPEVTAHFPETGLSAGGRASKVGLQGLRGEEKPLDLAAGPPGYGDDGSAARFFYSAKADSDDRLGSKHPTVKPLDLISWLVQLITPPGGVVLDPFAGTGTTGEAASKLGLRAVLIEREPQYQEDIKRRMSLAWAGPEERARIALQVAGKVRPPEELPLFNGDLKAAS